MIPTHWILSHSSISVGTVTVELNESAVNTITTQIKIKAKDRATRSLRLKVRAYSSHEKAVIEMPAVNI